MKIILDNDMYIFKTKTDTLHELEDELTFKNPDHGYALAMMKRGQYYHQLPPKYINFFERDGDSLRCPIGLDLRVIKKIAKRNNELVQIIDNRSEGHGIDFQIPIRGYFKGFDGHQDKIIENAIRFPNSVSSCPTGGGKTIAAMGIIQALKMSALILVDKADLLEQWMEEFEFLSDGEFTLGQYGCGKKNWGDVTVATVQTLKNIKSVEREKIKKRFGILIIDEVHKASAPIFTTGCEMFSAKYKHGLSATPYRRDQKDFIFKSFIGPVTLEISDQEVENNNRIIPMKYEFLDTGYSFNYDSIDQKIELFPLHLQSDFDRTVFVRDAVLADLEMGFIPIVISNRVPHLKNIHNLLSESGLNVGLIHGAVDKKRRKEIRHQMKEGELDCLVANVQIFGTGMNIPNLSSAHVCFYTTNKGLLKQISGRVRRCFGDQKYGKIVFYRDDVYVEEKNKFTGEYFRSTPSSFQKGYKSIESYFKKWEFERETEKVINV